MKSPDPCATLLSRTSIVLIETSEDLNIGMALRACRNMGIDDLRLVNPRFGDPERIAKTAPNLSHVAHQLKRYASTPEALADGALALGFTARPRAARRDVWSLEDLVQGVAGELPPSSENGKDRLLLVFGPERTGLSNEDLDRCQIAVHIPTAPDYSSLNLAQAVLLGCHGIRRAALAPRGGATTEQVRMSAPLDDLERLVDNAMETLDFIEFFKYDGAAEGVRQGLQLIFGRSRLDDREVRLLHGVFGQVRDYARRLEKDRT